MALSGTLTVYGYAPPAPHGGQRNYVLSWSATQNIATNSSTITWSIKAVGHGTDWTRMKEWRGSAAMAGRTIWSSTTSVMRDEDAIVASGTLTVQHDANGNATFSASMSVSIYDSDWLYTNSATFVLDRIYRGVVYIYDGTSFKEHACYIYNGSTWDMYQPYIYTGSGWEMY